MVNQNRITKCEIMGLSVYAEKSDAITCSQQNPKIGTRIAAVALTYLAGKILHTPKKLASHHTWWKPESYNPISASRVEN